MPRKWSNGAGGQGGILLRHDFVAPTPVRTLDVDGNPVSLRKVDHILADNAWIAGKEQRRRSK